MAPHSDLVQLTADEVHARVPNAESDKFDYYIDSREPTVTIIVEVKTAGESDGQYLQRKRNRHWRVIKHAEQEAKDADAAADQGVSVQQIKDARRNKGRNCRSFASLRSSRVQLQIHLAQLEGVEAENAQLVHQMQLLREAQGTSSPAATPSPVATPRAATPQADTPPPVATPAWLDEAKAQIEQSKTASRHWRTSPSPMPSLKSLPTSGDTIMLTSSKAEADDGRCYIWNSRERFARL